MCSVSLRLGVVVLQVAVVCEARLHCGALLPPALVGRSKAVRKALDVAFEFCSAALE